MLGMRVNLLTQSAGPYGPETETIPISLTIKPSCGIPGDYLYETDSVALMCLLERSTDLPASVLRKFKASLYASAFSKLLAVDLKDRALEEIGYFTD